MGLEEVAVNLDGSSSSPSPPPKRHGPADGAVPGKSACAFPEPVAARRSPPPAGQPWPGCGARRDTGEAEELEAGLSEGLAAALTGLPPVSPRVCPSLGNE